MTKQYSEIDLTDFTAKNSKLDSDHLIITTHPTQLDIKRAEEESKLLLVFVKYPKRIAHVVYDSELSLSIKSTAIEAWSDGIMQGFGIEPSPYMMLLVVGKDLDTERAIAGYKRAFYRREDNNNLPPLNHLGITNFITEDTLSNWEDTDDR